MEQQHYLQATGLVQPPPQTTPTTTDVHLTSVANATPTPPHLNSDHPSYTEMIKAAIIWDSAQGKAGGSSKRAIAKYIDRVYTNLPPTHSALLTHHLKRLKNTGQLVMIKNSYQLPIVAAPTTTTTNNNSPIPLRSVPVPGQPDDPTPKKRPGRPPKSTTPLAQPNSTVSISTSPVNGLSTGKRPRGRPPRNQTQTQIQAVSEVPFVQAQPNYTSDLGFNNGNFQSQSQSPQSGKRRPGRPSKKQAQEAQFQPINEGSMAVVSVNGSSQKRRGRPPRALNAGPKGSSGRGRGRPKRNTLGPIAKPIGKKTRGRPPKGSLSGVNVTAKTVRKYSGKPRGRPKKSASTPARRVADEELIKKVENMQAKVRDAVGVLKPYFTNENANEAITALQLLEDITKMDITTSSSKLPLNADNLFDDDTAIEPHIEETIVAPVSTYPEPQAGPEPPVMPFSISDTVMTGSAPFYVPPNVGTEQHAGSWMPSRGGQL